jgi:hypothetical protein
MANFSASAGAYGGGCKLLWSLEFDDAADTVTVTATHARFDDSPAPVPQQAQITFTLNGGVSIGLNLLTGRLTNNQPFDGTATAIINSGLRVRTGVRLQISAGRAALITHSTTYLPPVL